mmetsp:Transcript_3760/g.12950  ORF Transcript_3760/g.12950 Transcript_3760/m.12950 type:complete len:294 (-) Transcript_3760:418-1299(-)
MHVLAVLRQVQRLLRRGVAAADDRQLLALEDRRRAVADGARGDASAPERLLARDLEPLGRRARGQDHAVRLHDALAGLDHERPDRKVHALDVLRVQRRAPPLGLLAHLVHEVRPRDALRKPREVFHLSRRHELAARDAAGLEALEDDRGEVRSAGVDGRGVPRGAAADDDDAVDVVVVRSGGGRGRARRASPGWAHRALRRPRVSGGQSAAARRARRRDPRRRAGPGRGRARERDARRRARARRRRGRASREDSSRRARARRGSGEEDGHRGVCACACLCGHARADKCRRVRE